MRLVGFGVAVLVVAVVVSAVVLLSSGGGEQEPAEPAAVVEAEVAGGGEDTAVGRLAGRDAKPHAGRHRVGWRHRHSRRHDDARPALRSDVEGELERRHPRLQRLGRRLRRHCVDVRADNGRRQDGHGEVRGALHARRRSDLHPRGVPRRPARLRAGLRYPRLGHHPVGPARAVPRRSRLAGHGRHRGLPVQWLQPVQPAAPPAGRCLTNAVRTVGPSRWRDIHLRRHA